MKKLYKVFLIALLLLGLASCKNDIKDNDKITILSSFTIISDIASEIVKDKAILYNLVPTGTDPHEYEPLPNDIKAATTADLILYGGLNLEGGRDGWLYRLKRTVGKSDDIMVNLSEGIEPLYLTDLEDELNINPHFFIDPSNGILIANNILDALKDIDPNNFDYYEENARNYINRLNVVINKYEEGFSKIPDDKRILVTSERAFQYLAKTYNIIEAYIWAIDTEENGTPEQITRLIDFLTQNPVPYLLVESNVERSAMLTVSNETKIPIYHKPIYSDEIGKPGETVDTYIKYLTYNLDVILKGMNADDY